MKRVIVDYAKLTNEILNLLVEKYPDGYDESHIIRFKNHKDETIEAVEVRTDDTIYLVKISTKLSERMINFDDDDDLIVPLETVKGVDLDDNLEMNDDDEDLDKEEKIEFDDDDDLDDDESEEDSSRTAKNRTQIDDDEDYDD